MFTGELLRRAGISYTKLSSLIASGKIVPPPAIGNRRMWPDEAVDQIREAVQIDLRRRDNRRQTVSS